MKAKEVTARIVRLGGVHSHARGSHHYYVATYQRSDGSEGRVLTSVALHPGDVPKGTLRKIERDMEPAFGEGWSKR